MNKKMMAASTLIVMAILMAFSQQAPLKVYAADVRIIFISPITKTGKVGETITLIGTINTTGGMYEVLFDGIRVASNFAFGNAVNCSFPVPMLPGKNYTVILRDVNASIDSPPSWFYIETAYIVKVDKPQYPSQFQEGARAINISVSITGGEAKTLFTANVTVKTPANETYWSIARINTTDLGAGNVLLRYPEDFGNAHTNYTGTYIVYLCGTPASDKFFIGLTDQAEYHRGDTVKIKAAGYSSLKGTNVTITIKLENRTTSFEHAVSGDVIEVNWTIPTNALVGNYSLSVTPSPKKVNDSQVFAVPGFKTKIVPRNLADEPAPDVLVRVYDVWANTTYNVTSDKKGLAILQLERGEYDFTAYFKKVKVGEASFNITYEPGELNLSCQLTNLDVTVVSEQNPAIKIPFVSINLTVAYTTELNGAKIERESNISQTDISGSAQFKFLLLNASYNLAASRYGKLFNLKNDTLNALKPTPWNNVTIICPIRLLQVHVVDAKSNPVANDTLVEIQDIMGGFYSAKNTNQTGHVTFNCVFGIYNVKVYSKGILLNTTTVEMFEEKTIRIFCSLYNLPIYVKVVDFFGQPIPNLNVILERDGVLVDSKLTGDDGIADFRENGGILTIKVYLSSQNQPTISITRSILEARNETNPIEVKLSNYVVVAGFLIETSWFATIIMTVVTAGFFTVLEVVRRKRLK